jgi:mycobactin peptide synthetase MbtE
MRPELVTRRAEVERTMTANWREVLGVERVGLDDNFFDLGGNSLQAIQLYAMLRGALGVELAVLDLFKHPSIRSLVDAIYPGDAIDPPEASPMALQAVQERVIKQRQALGQRRPGVVRMITDHA